MHDSAACTTVPRARQCRVHDSAAFTTVPRARQCRVHDSAACTTVPRARQCLHGATAFLASSTQATTRDQAALGSRTTMGCMIDVFFRDREFSIATYFLQFSVLTNFSRSSIATENPGTWDFPMSRHRAYAMTMHDRGAHTIELSSPMLQ